MSQSFRAVLAALAAMAWLVPQIAEANSMRCGGKIIDEGDSKFVLVTSCGEPDHKSGNRWYYRQHPQSVTVVHIGADTITLIEIQRK